MAWFQGLRGNFIYIRLPAGKRKCAYANPSAWRCGHGYCLLDGSKRNLAECRSKCQRFKPTFWERVRIAWSVITWGDGYY